MTIYDLEPYFKWKGWHVVKWIFGAVVATALVVWIWLYYTKGA